MIFIFGSNGETNPTVSAQAITEEKSQRAARADRLAVALDLRAAAGYNVFAGKKIINQNSEIKGEAVSADTETGARARTDLARAFAALEQLPCDELNAELAGGRFAPGVYCAPSARLADEIILDGENNSQAVFIFRIAGKLRAESALKISLRSEARAENVYFVTEDSATIETGTDFKGNILARSAVTLQARAGVKGKIFSLDGEVNLTENDIAAATGVLQICKGTPPGEPTTGAGNLFDRIFRFRIGANIYEVRTGQCSGAITLPAGNYVIEELPDGRLVTGGNFNGRFKLLDVNSPTTGALGAVNLPLRTANVFIREGDATNQTVVNFVNTFAATAIIEICKRAVPDSANPSIQDRDVSGFFDFTVDAIANTIFTVPVGQCSGPIQVNVPTSPGPVPQPAIATIRVTELAEAGYTLESALTFPADRFISLTLNQGIRNTTACSTIGGGAVPPACLLSPNNNGGGYVTMTVLEGGASNQTTVNFFNRTNPGRVKVCKIAGPGIREGTRFKFTVSGLAPAFEGATPPANPNAILPGVPVFREVTVVAGPALQGGWCNFVEGRFIIGSIVTVTEQLPPLDPVDTSGRGEIRVSRIKIAPTIAGAVTVVNSDLANRTVTFRARREVTEAEFTNYVFRPTLLKICKIAGPGVTVGTPFTFDIAINTEGGLFSEPVSPLTVQAGPAAQGGYCAFANGPYPPINPNYPQVGTFRDGSTVVVTERPAPGKELYSITSTTGTVTVNLPNRSGILTLGFPGGSNDMTFSNGQSPCFCGFAPPFDFEGDRKTDLSIRRSDNSVVWRRSSNGVIQSVNFGLPTDRLVPADYDGDGKDDIAVYRDGTWHILLSANGQYRGVQFGLADDIPQPGDYDGDGMVDLAVFRPSNGFWYISRSRDGFLAAQFGTSGDKPILGDFDGDRINDLAVYRPSNGTWYILQSRDGFRAVQFGLANDKIVPADYDGDGKTDFAVYRDGAWYLLRSIIGFGYVQLGLATDTPLIADFNGDHKADISVYRAGVWHMLLSGPNENRTYASAQFGTADDFPIPATYVR